MNDHKKIFSKKTWNESQLNVESIQMSKIGQNLVKVWSFGFEVWLEIESILFGSYRSQDLTNTIDQNWFIFDRNEMWWLWMATWHRRQSLRLKRAFGNQWKIRKNRFLTRYSHFSSITLSRMPYWSSNLLFRWKFLVSVTGSPEFRRRFRGTYSRVSAK